MRGKKLTPKEQREKRVIQAFRSIQKLTKFYPEDVLITACYKYCTLTRQRKKAVLRKEELEGELEKLKKAKI